MFITRVFQQTEPGLIQLETIFIVSLLLITGIALLVRRVKVPYTVALVIAGLLLTVLPVNIPIPVNAANQLISSELILALFVPPLVFEGALHIEWRKFRSNLVPILLMAVFGVTIATLIVGGLIVTIADGLASLAQVLKLPALDEMVQIPLVAAIAFGALISATDPVAVLSFFRSLGVDNRLSILLEGESLLNDGTSIVIFRLALAFGGAVGLAHGISSSAQLSILNIIWEFSKVSVGGIIVGIFVGKLAEFVLKHTDARLVETTVTIAAAFGAYVLAETFQLSGILSVVAAGISIGTIIPVYTSPTTRIVLYNFWEVISFIITSLIFLIIGWLIDIRQFISLENIVLVLASVVAVLAARFLVVYGMSALSNYGLPLISKFWKFFKLDPIPTPYQHVMFWGGLRGAISLALALGLGADTFGQGVGNQLRLMTFGVVLFTLLVQGTTIERLIKRLGLAPRTRRQLEKERYLGNYYISLAAQEEVERLHKNGVLSGTLWKIMEETQQLELQKNDQAVRDVLARFPGMSIELALQARRSILNAQRTALAEAARGEVVSEEVQEEMLEEIDAHIEVLEKIAEQIHSTPRLIAEGDEGS